MQTDDDFGSANCGTGAVHTHAERAKTTGVRHAHVNQRDVWHNPLFIKQSRRFVQEHRNVVCSSLVHCFPHIGAHVQTDRSEVLLNVTSSQAIIHFFHYQSSSNRDCSLRIPYSQTPDWRTVRLPRGSYALV